MRPIRIIPRLDIKGPNLVKGVHLEGLRVLGLPERFSTFYFLDGADELIYMDLVASLYGRNNLEAIVRMTAENVFVPITVGGGIRTIDDIRTLLRAGADKVAINTAATKNPTLITEAANVFGSQCIVLSIEAMKNGPNRYEVYTDNGREPTGREVSEWVQEAVELGAGEVLVTSIDKEGTAQGYDSELIKKVVDLVNVPVIACGGAGSPEHVVDLIKTCNVDAVSAATLFHYHVVMNFEAEKRDEGNIDYIKKLLASQGSILRRLTPMTVSELKKHLIANEITCVESRYGGSTDLEEITIRSEPEKKETLRGRSRIILVDYGRSNLFSVQRALETIKAKVSISHDPEEIKGADKLIIAGVGAFGDGMDGLRRNNIIEAVKEFVEKGNPLLGICLGMQLFFEEGEEFGLHEGLGLIRGRVIRLRDKTAEGNKLKIPHIGWNNVFAPDRVKEARSAFEGIKLLDDVKPGEFMYFVHSYMVQPEDPAVMAAETEYGINRFCSVVVKDNIFGCQFHPERSGLAGLKIYHNFERLT